MQPLLAVSILTLAMMAFATEAPSRWVVVIDAGSSGSRVHVFGVLKETVTSVDLALPQPTFKQRPGLSTFKDKPTEAGTAIEPLIRFAEKHIPKEQWKTTRVVLGATAGLRLLTSEQSAAILRTVHETIKKESTFIIGAEPYILSGKEEGTLGWTAVNYLKGAFSKTSGKGLVAVLELGGASTQITVPISDPKEYPQDSYSITVLGKEHHVYTHSFLGWGQEAARAAYNKAIVAKASSGTVQDSCLQQGYSRSASGKADVYSGPSDDTVEGTGDYATCAKTIKEVLPKEECPSLCSLEGVPQPDLNKVPVHAFENYYYTAKAMGLSQDVTVNQLREAAKKYCATPWSEVLKLPGAESEDQMVKYCFSSAYQAALLATGLGLDASREIEVGNEIDGKDIDWALGMALKDIGAHGSPESPKATGSGAAVDSSSKFFVGCVMTGMVVAGLFITFRRRRGGKDYGQVPLEEMDDNSLRPDLKTV